MSDQKKVRIPTYPRCPRCGKQFLYPEELEDHLRTVHGYATPSGETSASGVSTTEYADLKKENAALRAELQELAALVKKGTAENDGNADEEGKNREDPVDTQIGTGITE